MIYNFEIEKQLLAGLIKESQNFSQISNFIDASDFYSEQSNLHSAIFTIIKQAINAGEEIDEIIIAQRVNSIGLSFEDNLNPSDYIKSLAMRKVPSGNLIKTAKELKKFSIRREIFASSQEMGKAMKSIPPESSYQQIVECADAIYNAKINLYEIGKDSPENIYADMEDIIEERGNSPITEFGMMGPHPKVNEIYGSLLRPGNITVITARSGVGKAQDVNSIVFTPQGSKRIGDVKLGDFVMGEDGLPKKVVGVYPQGFKKSYQITMSDGSKTRCCDEHLWSVQTSYGRSEGKFKTVSLKDILNDNLHTKCGKNRPNGKAKYSIQLADSVSFEKKDLPIHPYLLGVLLGDGCFARKDKILFTSADEFIVNKISQLLPDSDILKPRSQKYQYAIIKKEPFLLNLPFKNRSSSIANLISSLGLECHKARNKFIPEIYLYSSIEDRLEILRGLMDSDGSASCRNGSQSYFSSISLELIKGLKHLVCSLGGKCRINFSEKRNIYSAQILLFDEKLNPFSIPRKFEKFRPASQRFQKRYFSKIEFLGEKESVCIQVDSKSQLYLTDDFIVTHNTQFCMHYATKVSEKYGVPVLHFDNGEMSKEELVMRQCAALSGVPMHLIESGNWRRAGQDIVDKVRSVWAKIKHLQFYYYNVGGMDVDSMVETLKRFYYAKVGRGNQMIFSFDYIKTTSESNAGKSEWQTVGEMVDKFKKCIQKEILEDGNPVIPMITSVQSNRSGITNNRLSANVIDDESVVSLSDRITQFCSHMFILRNKTADEIQTEGARFGTHKLINVKSRHLGKDIAGAIEPVRIGDTLRKNFVNLEFANFNIAERGDLRDIARTLDGDEELDDTDNNDQIPNFDRF